MKTTDMEKLPILGKITFFFLGCSTLVGWNSILIGLDYFTDKFKGFDVSFIILIPMYIATNMINLIIHYLSRIMSMKTKIIAGLLGQIVILIILPIQAYYMSSDDGFYLAMFLIFIDGCAISIQQSSTVAFASLCSYQFVSIFFTGTGIVGVIISGVRLVILGSLGTENDSIIFIGILAYFSIAAVIIIITIGLFIMFYKTQYSQNHLTKTKIQLNSKIDNSKYMGKLTTEQELKGEETQLKDIENYNKILNTEPHITEENDPSQLKIKNPEIPLVEPKFKDGVVPLEIEYQKKNISLNNIKEIQQTEADIKAEEIHLKVVDSKKTSILKVFIKIQPFPLLIFLIYVQTFMLFPGLALKPGIDGINFAWSATLLILTYNVGDTIGKNLAGYRGYNTLKATLFILFRFIFYLFFLLLAADTIHASWFVVVNMFIFAFSNGYSTCAVMVLGPEAAEKDEKETAGYIMNNGLYLGMMCGSFLGLVFKNIGN